MGADLVDPPLAGQVLAPRPGRGLLWRAPVDVLVADGAARAEGLVLLHLDATAQAQLHRLVLVAPAALPDDVDGPAREGGRRLRLTVALASRPDDLDDAEKLLGEGSWRLLATLDERLVRSVEVGYGVRVYSQVG